MSDVKDMDQESIQSRKESNETADLHLAQVDVDSGPPAIQNFSGIWKVDEDNSQPLDSFLQALRVSWLYRKIACAIDVSYHIRHAPSTLEQTDTTRWGVREAKMLLDGQFHDVVQPGGAKAPTRAWQTDDGDLIIEVSLPGQKGTTIEVRRLVSRIRLQQTLSLWQQGKMQSQVKREWVKQESREERRAARELERRARIELAAASLGASGVATFGSWVARTCAATAKRPAQSQNSATPTAEQTTKQKEQSAQNQTGNPNHATDTTVSLQHSPEALQSSEMHADFGGEWHIEWNKSEKLGPLLKELGVPWFARPIAESLEIVSTIKFNAYNSTGPIYETSDTSKFGTNTTTHTIDGVSRKKNGDDGKTIMQSSFTLTLDALRSGARVIVTSPHHADDADSSHNTTKHSSGDADTNATSDENKKDSSPSDNDDELLWRNSASDCMLSLSEEEEVGKPIQAAAHAIQEAKEAGLYTKDWPTVSDTPSPVHVPQNLQNAKEPIVGLRFVTVLPENKGVTIETRHLVDKGRFTRHITDLFKDGKHSVRIVRFLVNKAVDQHQQAADRLRQAKLMREEHGDQDSSSAPQAEVSPDKSYNNHSDSEAQPEEHNEATQGVTEHISKENENQPTIVPSEAVLPTSGGLGAASPKFMFSGRVDSATIDQVETYSDDETDADDTDLDASRTSIHGPSNLSMYTSDNNQTISDMSHALPAESIPSNLSSSAVNFSGVWQVDWGRSQRLDRLFETMGIHWLARKLVSALDVKYDISHTPVMWCMKEQSSIGIFERSIVLDGRWHVCKQQDGSHLPTKVNQDPDSGDVMTESLLLYDQTSPKWLQNVVHQWSKHGVTAALKELEKTKPEFLRYSENDTNDISYSNGNLGNHTDSKHNASSKTPFSTTRTQEGNTSETIHSASRFSKPFGAPTSSASVRRNSALEEPFDEEDEMDKEAAQLQKLWRCLQSHCARLIDILHREERTVLRQVFIYQSSDGVARHAATRFLLKQETPSERLAAEEAEIRTRVMAERRQKRLLKSRAKQINEEKRKSESSISETKHKVYIITETDLATAFHTFSHAFLEAFQTQKFTDILLNTIHTTGAMIATSKIAFSSLIAVNTNNDSSSSAPSNTIIPLFSIVLLLMVLAILASLLFGMSPIGAFLFALIGVIIGYTAALHSSSDGSGNSTKTLSRNNKEKGKSD